jgi:hypothetical protein
MEHREKIVMDRYKLRHIKIRRQKTYQGVQQAALLTRVVEGGWELATARVLGLEEV